MSSVQNVMKRNTYLFFKIEIVFDDIILHLEYLILNQLNPYYLVISKAVGGRDITLDRVPVDVDNAPIAGDIGVLRDGFRIFSHRILKTPVKKSEDFEITVRWRIIMN